jgi:hypothetical protein
MIDCVSGLRALDQFSDVERLIMFRAQGMMSSGFRVILMRRGFVI